MPDVSVTIAPIGYAYQLAREIIDALRRQCPNGGCSVFEPHVTLQLVRGAPDERLVADAVEAITRRTRPFEIKFGTVGTFEVPLSVHVNLEPSAPLVRLYVDVKAALDDLGLQTYPYEAATWHPHLTLSCGHWSPEDVQFIRGMFTRLDASFLVERLQVNRLDPAGGWSVLREVTLSGDVGDPVGRAA